MSVSQNVLFYIYTHYITGLFYFQKLFVFFDKISQLQVFMHIKMVQEVLFSRTIVFYRIVFIGS